MVLSISIKRSKRPSRQFDFLETFADASSTRIINRYYCVRNIKNIKYIDDKTVFSYSPIKETIYLKRPPGIMPAIVKLNKTMVCVNLCMNGAIYLIVRLNLCFWVSSLSSYHKTNFYLLLFISKSSLGFKNSISCS